MVDPTKGERGKTGERGRTGAAGSPPLSRMQTIAMFVFVVAAFVVLAWRSEVNFNNNTDDTWRACTQTNRNSLAVNEILDQLIMLEGVAPPHLSKAQEQKRTSEYEALKIIPLDCPSPS